MPRNLFSIFHNEAFLFDSKLFWVHNYFEWVEFLSYKSFLKTLKDEIDKNRICKNC